MAQTVVGKYKHDSCSFEHLLFDKNPVWLKTYLICLAGPLNPVKYVKLLASGSQIVYHGTETLWMMFQTQYTSEQSQDHICVWDTPKSATVITKLKGKNEQGMKWNIQ